MITKSIESSSMPPSSLKHTGIFSHSFTLPTLPYNFLSRTREFKGELISLILVCEFNTRVFNKLQKNSAAQI